MQEPPPPAEPTSPWSPADHVDMQEEKGEEEEEDREAYGEAYTTAVWTVLAAFDGDSSFASAASWKAAQ